MDFYLKFSLRHWQKKYWISKKCGIQSILKYHKRLTLNSNKHLLNKIMKDYKWSKSFIEIYPNICNTWLWERTYKILESFRKMSELMERHLAQKLSFFSWRMVEILLRVVEILLRVVEILLWTVEIIMMNGRDFHVEWSRFSCWTVEIFLLNGRDFHYERSRFSGWQVKIYRIKDPGFFIASAKIP